MAKIITSLTDKQIAKFPEYVKKWTDIGLSCEPCDLEKAKEAVNLLYRCGGLEPPKLVLLADGPISGTIIAGLLQNKDSVWESVWASVGASVKDSVWASVRASVWDSVWDSVRASVGASVGDSVGASVKDSVWESVWDSVGASVKASVWASVWDSVRASVGASVWASVGASVRASVWDSVWDSVKDSVWASVRESIYGAHEAGWLSFYDYFRSECSLEIQTDKILGLVALAHHSGWCIPYKNVAIVQHRHSDLHRDARGRLHNPSGMAVKYRDGWGVYAWHGVRVPELVIDSPQSITPSMINGEANAEVRRVMVERYGFDKYLADGGFSKEHEDDFGTLFKREFPNEPMMKLVKVVNSTKEPDGSYKDYVIPVVSTVTTAHEAVASTFGLKPHEYKPEKES